MPLLSFLVMYFSRSFVERLRYFVAKRRVEWCISLEIFCRNMFFWCYDQSPCHLWISRCLFVLFRLDKKYFISMSPISVLALYIHSIIYLFPLEVIFLIWHVQHLLQKHTISLSVKQTISLFHSRILKEVYFGFHCY